MDDENDSNQLSKIVLILLVFFAVIFLITIGTYSVFWLKDGLAAPDGNSWWATLGILFTLIIAIGGINFYKERDLEKIANDFKGRYEELDKQVNSLSELLEAKTSENHDLANVSTIFFEIGNEINFSDTEKWKRSFPTIKEFYLKKIINEEAILRISSIAWQQTSIEYAYKLRYLIYENNISSIRYRAYLGNALIYADTDDFIWEKSNEENFRKFIIPSKDEITNEEFEANKKYFDDDTTLDSYRFKVICFSWSVWYRYCAINDYSKHILKFLNNNNQVPIINYLTQKNSVFLRLTFFHLLTSNHDTEKFHEFINSTFLKKNRIFNSNRIIDLTFKYFFYDIVSLFQPNDISHNDFQLIKNLPFLLQPLSFSKYDKVSLHHTFKSIQNAKHLERSNLILNLYIVFYWLCGSDDVEAEIYLKNSDILEIIKGLKENLTSSNQEKKTRNKKKK
jgi:hypothetical protein